MLETTTKKPFPLSVPVSHEGETYSEVTLRRPKGREIRNMRNRGSTPGIAGDLTFEMMANLAEVPEGVFDEMDGGDVRKIEAWLEGILGN